MTGEKKDPIGHRKENGDEQSLKEHLDGTASYAAKFGASFGAAEHAKRTALMHDVGKCSEKVQRRLRDPENVGKTDHSTAGAMAAWKLGDVFAAQAIAGHHSGLMNCGSRRTSTPSDGTFFGRIKTTVDQAYCDILPQLEITSDELFPNWLRNAQGHTAAMYTRMLFSCLVDADFLDTEDFMRDEPAPRGEGDSVETLLGRLREYIHGWFPPRGEINEKRCRILERCLLGGKFPKGIYTLTVPTGGGKTVSSLAFALTHAVEHGMQRIIYVVPYTSIIEQNADIFARILGDENVLEHHSGVDYEDADDSVQQSLLRKRLAAENWDAPVVVTTAVQFFESLYAARTSKCRKLHNMANAVIIFDEAQMMPVNFLRPCVAAISELVEHYGSTAVLCTATQPALSPYFKEYAPTRQIGEICEDTEQMYEFFRRVRFSFAGKQSNLEIAQHMNENRQVLCIVNTKEQAREIFESLEEEGRYHLSTLMMPSDRRRVISIVRERLKKGLPCRLVSTNLIEAGVDVDFPAVFREISGLDSILQAAGRCNREGKRNPSDSIVTVFECEGGVPRMFSMQEQAMKIVLEDRKSVV